MKKYPKQLIQRVSQFIKFVDKENKKLVNVGFPPSPILKTNKTIS